MVPILKHSFTKRIFTTLVFELLALNFCFTALVLSRSFYWAKDTHPYYLTALFALSNTFVVQFSLWSFGLYSRGVVYSGHRVFSNLIGSFIFSALLMLPVCYIFSLSGEKIFDVTLKFYLFGLTGFMSLIAIERTLILKMLDESPYMGNILILGTGSVTERVIDEARRSHGKTFRLVGVLGESARDEGQSINGCEVIGTLDKIQAVVSGHNVGGILICLPLYSPLIPVDFLMRCKLNGISVLDASSFYESLGKKVLLEKLDPIQLLLSDNFYMTRFRWILKTTLEKILATALLLLSLPVLLVTAVLIKLTSPGPLLYSQERVGKDGRTFKVYKFRSMVAGAEKKGQAIWAQKNDPRVTRIGKFIRKFRVDELPQLFNVLRGEMSIVGPRPERPEFVHRLATSIPFYDNRHLILPGITGWAQVVYPYGASEDDAREKLRYDLYYVKHMSLFFDAMILLTTIRTVLFGRGGR